MSQTPRTCLPALRFAAPLLAALAVALPASAADKVQRLEISTKEGVTAPDVKAIFHVLLGDQAQGGQRIAKVLRNAAGSTLQLDVSGATIPADAAAKLRAMFPALKDAVITLGEATGDGMAAPFPPLPPDFKEKDPAKIKAAIEKQLAAEGRPGNVNVQVTEVDGKKELKVTVESDSVKEVK